MTLFGGSHDYHSMVGKGLNEWNGLWGHNAMEVDNHLPDRLPILVKIDPFEIGS